MSEKSPFAGVFALQGGRVPRNMTLKVINDYLDEVDAPTMEPSALEDYTSQMRSGLAEITQRHIAKSVAQMTAWNWSRGRGIEELTRRFQEEQKKEQIDMSKVLPNAETVVRTESMKILNAEAWRSATEVGSYADGLLWGFSYHAVGDSRTRQTHLAQHGVCAPVDDLFWNEWTPPNGYNCRCWLISEWEEPSSYKQPRRDLHPDPGFAFNPANNVAGRVPQPKKQEQKKTEVNTQAVVKPAQLVQNQEISSKYEKNIQTPVTAPNKIRYNKEDIPMAVVFRPLRPEQPPIPDEQEGTIIPTPDGKFLAVHGPMVKTTRTKEEAAKAIRDVGGKVPEEKPEIRKEKDNNDSKRGITKQNLQDALEEFHDKNSVNTGTTLIASLLPDGRLVVKKGEEVVAEISTTEFSKSIISSVDGLFHAIVNGSAKVFSKLWLFFKNVSEQNGNADIVETENEKKERIVKSLFDGIPSTDKERLDIIEAITNNNDKEKNENMSSVIKSFGGGGWGMIQAGDITGDSDKSDLLDEYIQCCAQYAGIITPFYRGMHFDNIEVRNDFIEKLECSYLMPYTTSWTSHFGTADNFARLQRYSLVLCLEKTSRMGFVGKLSFNMEFECILRRNTVLKIVDVSSYDKSKEYCFIKVIDQTTE